MRSKQPAAETKKAVGANQASLQMPIPPKLVGVIFGGWLDCEVHNVA